MVWPFSKKNTQQKQPDAQKDVPGLDVVLKGAVSSYPLKADVYRGGMWFFGAGQKNTYFDFTGAESALDAYKRCPEFQAIVNKRAMAHGNGKRWIMTTSGQRKEKEATSEFAKKCRKLLANPNPSETGQLFEARLKIYLDVFGWVVILPIYPKGFEGQGVKLGFSEADYLFLIPPYMLSWTETGSWKNQRGLPGLVKEMILTVGGERTELDLNQIAIIKDITPRMCGELGTGGMAETLVFPESRVRAQRLPINNIIAAYESRGELISFAGAQGLISPDAGTNSQFVPMGLTEEEEKQIHTKFKQQYGIGIGQARYVISPQPLKWSQIGRPTKDLMLFEEVDSDVKVLCNAWPIPYKLLGETGSSLNGTEVDALMAGWYQNDIIPEAASIDVQLMVPFKAAENNCRFEKDFSHVSALQEDEKEKAEAWSAKVTGVDAAWKANFITYNRAMEMLGEDTVEATEGNMYYDEWTKSRAAQNNPDGGQIENTGTGQAADPAAEGG